MSALEDIRDQEQVSRLLEDKSKAEAEVQSIRSKLHSAVRKGKAIEAERASLLLEVESLRRVCLSDTRCQVRSPLTPYKKV